MNWSQLYDMIIRLGGWLVQPDPTVPSVPQHAAFGAPTDEEEKWADDWVRKFFYHPDLVPPTPRQRYVLVPRFRYARGVTSIYARLDGAQTVSNPAAKWEELLVNDWREKWRATWLSAPHIPDDDQNALTA